jgi:SAM-dependent methyltransferase
MLVFLRSRAHRLLLTVMDRFTTAYLEDIAGKAIARRARALPPDQALCFLFRLDNRLYQLEGTKAVEYGDGVHTKHRHTRYHDFFVARVWPDDRVLDIGCGNGVMSHDLADKAGAKVLGIDISQEKITQAQSRYQHQNLQFIAGDVLKGIHPSRVLIRVPLYDRDWRVPLKQELGIEWRLDPTHEIEYTLESFAQEMNEARLKIIHQEIHWGEIWAEAVPHA